MAHGDDTERERVLGELSEKGRAVFRRLTDVSAEDLNEAIGTYIKSADACDTVELHCIRFYIFLIRRDRTKRL